MFTQIIITSTKFDLSDVYLSDIIDGLLLFIWQPWIQTSMMFLGESTSFILYIIWKIYVKTSGEEEKKRKGTMKERLTNLLLFCFFALCDLFGTTLASIGLLYVPASIFQLLRGAIIIFTELFSICVFRRRPVLIKWLGIGIVCFFS